MQLVAGTLGVVGLLASLLAFIWELQVIFWSFGALGVVLGLVAFPVLIVAAPWLAIVQYGAWAPLLVGYGGAGLLYLAAQCAARR